VPGLATIVAMLLRFRARACVVLACVAAMLCAANIASANANAQPKTRVWDFSSAAPLNTCPIGSASPRLHPENRPSQSESASGSPHAARAAPEIAKASNGEMLGQAISHVKGLSGTAAQKADLFQQLGGQITKLSGGSWTAVRGLGTEGSHVFLGGAGEALVINPAGQLFRGSLQTGGVSLVGPGRYALDFAKLTGL
jgi:hypothetical protein